MVKISPTSFYAEELSDFIDELGDDWLVDNLMQLNLYACSSFMQERGIDFAFLYRYNKNDSRHMEVRFKPSMKAFNYVQQKFQKIATMVDAKEVPASCEFPLGSIRYAFCDCHKMLSYADTDPLKSFFATLPPKVFPKPTSEMSHGEEMEEQYKEYKKLEKKMAQKEKLEQKIVQLCLSEQVAKVKFKDNEIYQVKLLKSPREHFELRRSK